MPLKVLRGELDIVRLKVMIRLPDTYVCHIYISDKAFRDGYNNLRTSAFSKQHGEK